MVEIAELEEVSRAEQPFAKCAFGDERFRLARMFTNYFNRTKSDAGYVANLNGEWGTGKTFFVTEWSRLLKTEDYGVVFIDAWKSDYLDDPLSIVVAEVLQQLTAQLKTKFDVHDIQELTNGIFKTSGGLIKAFLPVLTKAVGNKFLGEEAVDLLTEFIDGTKEFLDQDNPKSLNSRLGEFGQLAFSAHLRHCQFANDFKDELQELINLTTEKSGKEKVYIFIDELDRCRPTYAIEMLETIKHLFDIKNLVFIISTDTAQLEHSIKAVYGSGFDSFEYLHRFFKQKITLPKPDYYKFLCMANAFDGLDFTEHHYYPNIDSADKLRALVALQAENNEIELRKLENIYSQIDVFLTNIELKNKIAIDLIFLVSAIFTINLSQIQPLDYTRSIKPEIRDGGITVHKTRITNSTNSNIIEFYNQIAYFFITEFENLSNHQKQIYKPSKLDFDNPSDGAAKILFLDIVNGYYFTYINNLENDLTHSRITLLTHSELTEMIRQLKISDIFNQ
jgi:hypothetical protein